MEQQILDRGHSVTEHGGRCYRGFNFDKGVWEPKAHWLPFPEKTPLFNEHIYNFIAEAADHGVISADTWKEWLDLNLSGNYPDKLY